MFVNNFLENLYFLENLSKNKFPICIYFKILFAGIDNVIYIDSFKS